MFEIGGKILGAEHMKEMYNYLTKNNREVLKEYEKGLVAVRDITKATNLDRHYFYNTIAEIDPHITERRKTHRLEIIKDLIKQIELCIPFEYIDINFDELFGKDSGFKDKTAKYQKTRLTNILVKNNYKPEHFKFITIERTLTMWYRIYLMSQRILKGEETGYRIAKNYNVNPSEVYNLRDYMAENDNRILSAESLEQEQQFLKNVKMFEDYKTGSSIEDLESKYNLESKYINLIIESLDIVDVMIHDKK